MSLLELFILAIGLSMDAFAVGACKGLSVQKVKMRHALCAGIWFGGFQALMPLIGWAIGSRFQSLIENVDHWIAFILLAILGINMIREGIKNESEDEGDSFGWKQMFPMAIATSIDALAVGVTFAFLQVRIIPAITFIGCTTFILSAIAVRLGGILGARCQRIARIAGGCILILIGLKILLEHLGLIAF